MKENNMYRFKDIKPVISAKDLVDVVLSRTQRKTPTEIHKGFKITRIRNFYMRKVKMCQELFKDKLQTIIMDFPKLDDIHPFYADLANILYDRDHFKLALGQCSYASKSIVKICHDYIKLLKFSSSLYKCKMLKISALGRMCKVIKKLQPSLLYLEEVRQNLARLPTINPHKKTILLSGAPNVGKSSFINAVSRANVEIQPYAFTTKNLYIGHFDQGLNKYQIIDTPGLLDRPLNNRNTIEMTTITALAHINGVILFIIDISETCGFTIKEQVNLFYSIKSLFINKSIVIGFNKIDKCNLDLLSLENKEIIKNIVNKIKTPLMFCSFSTLTGIGVEEAKIEACNLLKTNNTSNIILLDQENIVNNKINEHQTNSDRAPYIPPSVIEERKKNKIKIKHENNNIGLITNTFIHNGNSINNGCQSEPTETCSTVASEKYKNLLKSESGYSGYSGDGGGDGGDGGDDNTMDVLSQAESLPILSITKCNLMREEKLKKKDKSRQSYLSNRTDDKVLQIDLQNKNGGAGVYSVDVRNHYDIKEEYKYDVIPEIYNGKNIADFIDPNIEEHLLTLLKEEEELLLMNENVELDPLWFKLNNVLKKMSLKLERLRLDARLNTEKQPISHKKKKTIEDFEKKIDELKLNKEKILASMTEKARRKNKIIKEHIKVKKDISKKTTKKQIKDTMYNDPTKKSKIFLSTSTELQRKKAYKLNKMAYKQIKKGTKGEADRTIIAKKPKHLFSGKMSLGTSSHR
ncbi:nucleolar GTP-binding protein 1, putative [Hepatocystis sp. ex Piliocolobus tephrosceles]|nr:nucleolar GTP-binding protein 1, putative [Hepatocystis sp. ex Piliocolobus tephrosceles]